MIVQPVTYGYLEFESPRRWVICILGGSVRNIRNLEGMLSDPGINVILVCLTTSTIDHFQLEQLKEFVKTSTEGGLIVLGDQTEPEEQYGN